MSDWTDRIRAHAIWKELETLGPAVDQALGRQDLTPTAQAGLSRIKTVVGFTGKRLSAADSLLILPRLLDNIASSLEAGIAEVQGFVANGNEDHITNANNQIDNALSSLAQVIVPVASKETAGLREAADAYRSALESNLSKAQDALTSYQADLTAVQEKLSILTTEISTERQHLSSLTSEHQSQFSVAQETRSKDYLEAQTARQDKFATLIADYSQKLVDQTAEFSRQRDQLVQAQRDELAALTATYKDEATSLLTEIQEHGKEVEKLVGVIGTLGVTSGYQKAANEARTNARVWQIIAVLSLIIIIIVAFKAFLPLVQGAFSWEGFAGRVFVSLTVGVLAAYAISQADRYQQVERRSRKLALELEALGPFVASLPLEKQEEFRLRVGDRSFGISNDLIDSGTSNSPKSVIDVALKSKELSALIVDVIKAVRGGS